MTQLEENQRQMNDALELCKAALETNDPNSVSYYSLKLEPDFREAKKALEEKPVSVSLRYGQLPFRRLLNGVFSVAGTIN